MFRHIDIRKSALTFLAAAALSLTGMLASSVHAAPLAALSHQAARHLTQNGGQDTHHNPAGASQHKLTRPANRFNGTAAAR